MTDRLEEMRERLGWWMPDEEKVLSVSGMRDLLEVTAWLLAEYDRAGMQSDRAQVLRATLERWEDNPPTVGQPVDVNAVFRMVSDANWLLGVVDGRLGV